MRFGQIASFSFIRRFFAEGSFSNEGGVV